MGNIHAYDTYDEMGAAKYSGGYLKSINYIPTRHADLTYTRITAWDRDTIRSTEGMQIYKFGTTLSPVTINKIDIRVPATLDRPLVCLNWNGEPDPEAVLQGVTYDSTGRMLTGNCLKCKNKQDTLYLTGEHTGSSYGKAGSDVGGTMGGLQYSSDAIPSIFAEEDFVYTNGIMTRSVTVARANQTKLKGICVGPCDTTHTIHDGVHLLKSPDNSSYYLYGGTCHDDSYVRFNMPSIPPKYIEQVGNPCKQGYTSTGEGSSGKCVQEIPLGDIDNGSTYAPQNKMPDEMEPVYSCRNTGTATDLVDNMCFQPCPPPQIANGAYCIDPEPISTMPSSIQCTKAPYTFAARGSGSAKTVNKWLCETQDDLDALVQGIETGSATGASSYVADADIVCVATDTTTGTYFCQRVDEAVKGTDVSDMLSSDYSNTCNMLINSYTDISNNMTILYTTLTTSNTAQTKIDSMRAIIDDVVRKLCASNGSQGSSTNTFCDSLNSYLINFDDDIDSSDSYISGKITGPLLAAKQSRDALVSQIRALKCSGFIFPPGS